MIEGHWRLYFRTENKNRRVKFINYSHKKREITDRSIGGQGKEMTLEEVEVAGDGRVIQAFFAASSRTQTIS